MLMNSQWFHLFKRTNLQAQRNTAAYVFRIQNRNSGHEKDGHHHNMIDSFTSQPVRTMNKHLKIHTLQIHVAVWLLL